MLSLLQGILGSSEANGEEKGGGRDSGPGELPWKYSRGHPWLGQVRLALGQILILKMRRGEAEQPRGPGSFLHPRGLG